MTIASFSCFRFARFAVLLVLLDVAAFAQPHPKTIRFRGESVGERIAYGGLRSGTPLGFVVMTFEDIEGQLHPTERLYFLDSLSSTPVQPNFIPAELPQNPATRLELLRMKANSDGVWSFSPAGMYRHLLDNNIKFPCADSVQGIRGILPLPNGEALACLVMQYDTTNPDSVTYAYVTRLTSSNTTCTDVTRPLSYDVGFLTAMCLGSDGRPIYAVRPRPHRRGDGEGLIVDSDMRRLPIEGLDRRKDYDVMQIHATQRGYRLFLQRHSSTFNYIIVECDTSFRVISVTPISPSNQHIHDFTDDGLHVVVTGDSTVLLYNGLSGIQKVLRTQDIRKDANLTARDFIVAASYHDGNLYVAFDTVIVQYQIDPLLSVDESTEGRLVGNDGLLDLTDVTDVESQRVQVVDVLGRQYFLTIHRLADRRFISTQDLSRGLYVAVGGKGSISFLCDPSAR